MDIQIAIDALAADNEDIFEDDDVNIHYFEEDDVDMHSSSDEETSVIVIPDDDDPDDNADNESINMFVDPIEVIVIPDDDDDDNESNDCTANCRHCAVIGKLHSGGLAAFF